ncbi:MAG: hypothetical protein AB1Z98_10600 [Nannocystaceae bacterium]
MANREACERAQISADALQQTIDERLGLNCERLRVAREGVVDNLSRWVVDVFSESLDQSPNLTEDEAASVRAALVGGRLRPDAHGHLVRFWTTERQYLGDPAEEWIRDHAAQLHWSQSPTGDVDGV